MATSPSAGSPGTTGPGTTGGEKASYDPKTRVLAVAVGHLYGGQEAVLVFDALVTGEATIVPLSFEGREPGSSEGSAPPSLSTPGG